MMRGRSQNFSKGGPRALIFFLFHFFCIQVNVGIFSGEIVIATCRPKAQHNGGLGGGDVCIDLLEYIQVKKQTHCILVKSVTSHFS